MKTVFARWTEVKTGLQAEVIRLDACIQEADTLIKANCGQKRKGYYHLPDCAVAFHTKYVLGLDIQKVHPEKHCNRILKNAEEMLAKASSITTETLLEAWEKSQ